MTPDEKWMLQAIALAGRGISGASPNPLVGSVIVKNNRVAGRGYHSLCGAPHAEINALENAGEKASGAALYVNLEPCCHWGKTPPCTSAIIRAGVRTVVIAMPDPNPLVYRQGIKKLKEAGIIVKTGVCRKEAEEINRPFIKFMTKKKPYVILKSAVSLDGKIATRAGESRWMTSSSARSLSYQMRTEVDAIMVGAETVRKDNPSLTSHGKGRDPVRVVISGSGRIPAESKIFNGQSPSWIFHSRKSLRNNRGAHSKALWFYCPSRRGKIEFSAILKKLAEKGISKLLVEGGGETLAAALESKEIDELFVFMAPLLIGGRNAVTAFEGTGFKKIHNAFRFKKMTAQNVGEDILIHAYA